MKIEVILTPALVVSFFLTDLTAHFESNMEYVLFVNVVKFIGDELRAYKSFSCYHYSRPHSYCRF